MLHVRLNSLMKNNRSFQEVHEVHIEIYFLKKGIIIKVSGLHVKSLKRRMYWLYVLTA